MRSVQMRLAFCLATDDDEDPYVPTAMEYKSLSPWEAAITFHLPESPITWTMAREVLDRGLMSPEPVGEGDVEAWSDDDTFYLRLMGATTLYTDAEDMEDFLYAAYEIVPEGAESEQYDLDTELAKIFTA